jgi:DNA-binding Lrp family transcriptional regulator
MRRAFDDLDARLLALLRRDARARIVDLAALLDVPTSTVHDRIARLGRLGTRWTALLDWESLGCSLTVCLVTPYDGSLATHPAVNTCVRLAPNVLFLECVFATMLELERFTAALPGTRVYPVVETLKKEGFVPESPPADGEREG